MTNNVLEFRPAPDLKPVLGEIARTWRRISPQDLTAPEALRLLGLLAEIADRIDVEAG